MPALCYDPEMVDFEVRGAKCEGKKPGFRHVIHVIVAPPIMTHDHDQHEYLIGNDFHEKSA